MKLFVTAKANAKKTGVTKIDETHVIVAVKEPPREGKANHAIQKALAAYFHVPAMHVRLVSGATAKRKTFEIT